MTHNPSQTAHSPPAAPESCSPARRDHQAPRPPEPRSGRFNLLIIDDEPDVRRAIREALPQDTLRILQAGSLAEARRQTAEFSVDVALIDILLPDGSGLEFAAELKQQHPACQEIVMTGSPSPQLTIEAMRCGARDFLTKPFALEELNLRVQRALDRRRRSVARRRHVRKLKKLVRKLDHDRRDISQQVDILCKDLVGAYQDVAVQMKLMEKLGEFKAVLREELDLEQALRLTLQFLLDQIGPTNAVIFLPNGGGGYSVGGFVNYATGFEDPHVLLEHLADVAAPRIVDEPEACHLADNELIEAWLGDDANWLADQHLILAPCRDDEQAMAAMLLFRDADQPFRDEDLKLINYITPFFGTHLSKLVRVHHRMARFFEDEDDFGAEPWQPDDEDPDELFGV